MITYVSYRLAAFLSKRLPQRLSYRLAVCMADAFHRLDRRGREAVKNNLSVILRARGGDPTAGELHRLSRRMFHCFGKYLVDFFRYSNSSSADVEKIVTVEHAERMKEAAQAARGVIVVSAHVGNWDLGSILVGAAGYRLNAVALPQRHESVNRLFQEQRANRGVRILPHGRAAAGILDCLGRKEWVALLADRDFSPHSANVELFGRPARLPRGPAHLAARLGAPILPTFVLRKDDDSFVMRHYPPIIPDGESENDLQARICRILEEVIGGNPHQWFMFRDFWAPNRDS